MTVFLRHEWQRFWTMGDAAVSDALLQNLLDQYGEPQRHYHNLQHLQECLSEFSSQQHLAHRASEVGIALFFHDAIYDVRRHDNEARSAEWARAEVIKAGADSAMAERIYQLIMATQHQGMPELPDAQLLVDIDLAILAAEPPRFDEYERQIRTEYAWVPDTVFRSKRTALLQALLARSAIYFCDPFKPCREAKARSNLQRAIARLSQAQEESHPKGEDVTQHQ